MAEWSPWRKWCMDLVKWIVTLTVGSLVGVYVFDDLEHQRDRERARAIAVYDNRRNAVDDFRVASLRYREAAFDAYVDLYDMYDSDAGGEKPPKTSAMRRYEEGAYDELVLAVEAIRIHFAEAESLLATLSELEDENRKRHRIYDVLLDFRRDDLGAWAGTPRQKREEFDSLLGRFTTLRGSILRQAEDFLLENAR